MTITVPTTTQIATTLEGIARLVASILVAVYVAGEMTGKSVHNLSDWLAEFTRQPLQTIIDAIPVREPQPEVLAILGAQLLEPAELELEIREFEAKQPVARRKPARARKTAVAA